MTSSLLQQARLIAVSPAGSQLWSTPIGNSSKSSPTVRNGRVYIGNDQGQVLAVYATTGQVAWTYTMQCPFLQSCRVESSPAVSGLGEVIFGVSNGAVIALQDGAQSATLRWSVSTQGPIAGSPILSNNRVIYIGAGTRLYALRADTGAQVFRSQTFGIIAGTPSLTPTGTLLIGSDDNFVRAFTGP
jgi:outer membrane protein assembly factor BamB